MILKKKKKRKTCNLLDVMDSSPVIPASRKINCEWVFLTVVRVKTIWADKHLYLIQIKGSVIKM